MAVGYDLESYSCTPHEVLSGASAIAAAAGDYHSAALAADGSVWSWGYNFDGQLGNGTTEMTDVPVRTSGLEITDMRSVTAGNHFSLALGSDGTLWAWGLSTGDSWDRMGRRRRVSRRSR